MTPTLAFLPSLTPVEESRLLLEPAYDALIALADARFPGQDDAKFRHASLDRILRRGIFQGYFSCKDNVQILEILTRKLDVVVLRMGLHAVIHLRV